MKQFWHRLVRSGFRLLYNELAWSYDAVSWLVSLGEWRRWQEAALPALAGRDVLELGHGPGHMLLALHNSGRHVVGLDLSPFMGRLARRRLRRKGVTVTLVRGRSQALPFAAGSFDSVLATFPTDYVVDPQTLDAVYSVLRRGGRLVVVVEAHLSGSGPLHRLIEWLFRVTGQRSDAFAADQAAAWEPFRRRFRAAGFAVEIESVDFARSSATLIIATRPSNQGFSPPA